MLLMIPASTADGISPGIVDALFTATSAVCVTGLVVVNTATFWSVVGKVVIIVLIQIGGLGLMTFSTAHALVVGRRIGLMERLVIQEQTGQWRLAGVVALMKRIILVTLGFELVGTLLLTLTFWTTRGLRGIQAVWYGFFHAVSAFCNAGFDILGNSLMDYTSNAPVTLTVGFLIIFGGLGFHVITDVIIHRGKWAGLSLHSRLVIKVTAVLIVIGTLAVLAMELGNPGTLGPLDAKGKLLASWFQAVTPRTAGFNSVAIDNLLPSTALITIAFMFIGASPGSTGGGVKTTTFAVVAKSVMTTVSGGEDVNMGNRRVPQEIVSKAVAIVLLAVVLVLAGTLILTRTESKPFMDLLFEVISAFGTVGLTRGITPSLSVAGKLVIAFMMFVGRVGPVSLAVALTGKGKESGRIRYPQEKISVG
jgi:trk system potassium uptake protein TrkH